MEFLREEDYNTALTERVLPLLAACRREEEFVCADGAKLFAVRYEARQPRGSVVILHGFGENVEKYRELCYYFLKSGLTVQLFEQRGHARSTREVEPGLVYIKRFSQYVSDFSAFMEANAPFLPTPRYLFAHSMGGAVSALYLSKDTGVFTRAVLSSPMIAMQYKRVPRFLGYGACALLGTLMGTKRRFVGVHPAPPPEKETLERSGATSLARFEAYRAAKVGDKRLHAASATFAWTREALGCTRDILKKGVPERIRIPVRVYAAEQEVLVQEGPQRRFAARVPKGEFRTVRGAKHEIYFSKDEVAHPYFAEILSFFGAEE